MSISDPRPPEGFQEGHTLTQLYDGVRHVFDAGGADVELLHGLTMREIHKAFPPTSRPTQEELEREMHPRVRQAVEASPEHKAALGRLVERYQQLPQAATIEPDLFALIIWALILGAVILGAIFLYYAANS